MSANPFNPAPQIVGVNAGSTFHSLESPTSLILDGPWPAEIWIADETIEILIERGWAYCVASTIVIDTDDDRAVYEIDTRGKPGYFHHAHRNTDSIPNTTPPHR